MLKTDDDTIVDLNLLQNFIDLENNRLSNLMDKRKIYGNVIYNALPKRKTDSKWFVTLSEFKYPFFPDYCNGASCLFTKEAAKSILYNVPKVKYFWIDDVLFMGIIPMITNIELVDMKKSFGSTDLIKHWQATCDFFNYSGLISFYLNDEDFEQMDELFIKCPPVQWFWKHFSASEHYNLELFF